MKKQKIIIGSIVILTIFTFVSLTSKYNLTVKKHSITEDIEKIMIQNQQELYSVREPKREGSLELLVKNIEKESIENTKNKYKVELENVRSEIIKEHGKTYIVLEADLKNKFLNKKINLKAKSEPQLFYDGGDNQRFTES